MLDYWGAEQGDSHLMVDYRELIEESSGELNLDQKATLKELDARAKALLDSYQGAETWDVKMLREAVSMAYPEYRKAA